MNAAPGLMKFEKCKLSLMEMIMYFYASFLFNYILIGGHAKCAFFRSCGTNGQRKHTTPTQDNLEIGQEDDDAKCAFIGHSNSGVFKLILGTHTHIDQNSWKAVEHLFYGNKDQLSYDHKNTDTK